MTGNILVGPLIEQCRNKWGTVSGAMSLNAFGIVDDPMMVAIVHEGLTESSDSVPPLIMFDLFNGIYATGTDELPITMATGRGATAVDEKDSALDCITVAVMDAAEPLTRHLISSTNP
jgi:hypothetical protein